jgi:antitoxin FitA
MATITIKNIPDDIYELLKEKAKSNNRSINSEAIIAIKLAVASRPIDVQAAIQRARKIQELTAHYRITDQEITKFKNEGRK